MTVTDARSEVWSYLALRSVTFLLADKYCTVSKGATSVFHDQNYSVRNAYSIANLICYRYDKIIQHSGEIE
jgi:hypothetical protein